MNFALLSRFTGYPDKLHLFIKAYIKRKKEKIDEGPLFPD